MASEKGWYLVALGVLALGLNAEFADLRGSWSPDTIADQVADTVTSGVQTAMFAVSDRASDAAEQARFAVIRPDREACARIRFAQAQVRMTQAQVRMARAHADCIQHRIEMALK